MDKMDAPVIFLGFCERFSEPVIGHFKAAIDDTTLIPITRQDILGLKNYNILPLYPLPLHGWHIIFLIDKSWFAEQQTETILSWKVVIENLDGEFVGDINIEIAVSGGKEMDTRFIVAPVELGNIMFKEPSDYRFYLINKNEKKLIGVTHFYYKPALPLTEDRIKAIESDPLAYKFIRMEQSCKFCGETLKISIGVKKNEKETGYIWYKDLPDVFKCGCNKMTQNLKYIKESGHGLLGQKQTPFSNIEQIERSYTHSALEDKTRRFNDLINKKGVSEDEVQKFMDKNTIVFNIFSPLLIQGKSPVNSAYETDFVILNHKKEILLIEIEKPEMPIFRKNGDITSKLTHAFGQVESWLSKARRNKLAVIDDLKLHGVTIDEITKIKGIVIAGKSKKGDLTYRERMVNRQDIDFYTYDDIFAHLRKTIDDIKQV